MLWQRRRLCCKINFFHQEAVNLISLHMSKYRFKFLSNQFYFLNSFCWLRKSQMILTFIENNTSCLLFCRKNISYFCQLIRFFTRIFYELIRLIFISFCLTFAFVFLLFWSCTLNMNALDAWIKCKNGNGMRTP